MMIKIRYVALIEVKDEIEPNDGTLPIDEIRQNFRTGMVEEELERLISEGFVNPEINITPQLVDVIEVEE